MSWKPLSQRSGEKPADVGPFEGVPQWLSHSLTEWCVGRFRQPSSMGGWFQDHDRLNRVERRLKLRSLPSGSFDVRLAALMEEVRADPTLFIDLADLLVSEVDPNSYSEERKYGVLLAKYLDEAGSVWQVVERGGVLSLERRVEAEVVQAADLVIGASDRAGQHLRLAWQAVYGRRKDASTAYREAVRAVEAVAKPVVIPNDSGATLGKMIKAIKDAPQKWEFILRPKAGDSVATVLTTMELLWTAQLDRHGTDDESAPLSVSDLEAESALHLGITLVHWFRIGAFRCQERQS